MSNRTSARLELSSRPEQSGRSLAWDRGDHLEADTKQRSGAGDQGGWVEAQSRERGRASQRAVATEVGELDSSRERGGDHVRERLTVVCPTCSDDLGRPGLGGCLGHSAEV
jgi:hypothetical protein